MKVAAFYGKGDGRIEDRPKMCIRDRPTVCSSRWWLWWAP